MSKRIPRRTLLRGAFAGGAIAIALPWLEAMDPPKAQAAPAAPKRIVFWFTANGTLPDIWLPPQSGALDLSTHPMHSKLAPLQDKLIFCGGVDDKTANVSIGDGHQTGMACLLTNSEILPGSLFCEGDCPAGAEVYVGWGGGISVDQHIANEIAKTVTTSFRSLELGVQVKSSNIWSRLCYAGADQPIPAREDPAQNLVDLFSDLGTDPFALELLRKKRKSVLDAVQADYKSFNPKLGKDDRVRLEQHLESIRSVEQRLDATGAFGEACVMPNPEMPGGQYQQNDLFPVTGKAQMDLLVMALACDMTRVSSLQWSHSVSNVQHNWVPQLLGGGHHDLSHYDDSDGSAYKDILEVNKWYTEQFAYLLTSMQNIQEGDSTLLDNTVVVWVNELGKGNTHTRNGIPFMLAGGCQGHFKTGRAIDFGGQPHGRLLVSLCQAMDVNVDTFGKPENSQGPLPGLTA